MGKNYLIGANTVHVTPDRLFEMGFEIAEVCLGGGSSYEERVNKVIHDINAIESKGKNYSIHLPVYVEDWYTYNFLDAFYIDEDEEKRKISIRLLELNLKKLSQFKTKYFVVHFPGINNNKYPEEEFEKYLQHGLSEINRLAKEYDKYVLLEYFGSNVNFYEPEKWVREINKYPHIGLLTDTGHLSFSSIKHGFDYYEALDTLAEASTAFHIWTAKGKEYYDKSFCYKKNHHIIPRLYQTEEKGWAFDTTKALDIIKKHNKPIIIEATPIYKGRQYYDDGLVELLEYMNK